MTFYKCPKCQKNSVQEYLDSLVTGTVHCSKLNRKVIVRRIKRGWHCLLPRCGGGALYRICGLGLTGLKNVLMLAKFCKNRS